MTEQAVRIRIPSVLLREPASDLIFGGFSIESEEAAM